MKNTLPKLPLPKKGMRRVWDQQNKTWNYTPVPFPEIWDRSQEWIMWNGETDSWELVSKRHGKHIVVDDNNYVEMNLRLRSLNLID